MSGGGGQRQSAGRIALFSLALVVAYVVTGRLGLSLAYYNRMATLLWAPSGLAVAAVWLGGRRMAPAVAIGAFLTNMSIGATPLLAVMVALGNMGEALVADVLVERAGLRRGLHSVRDVIVFVGLIVGASTFVAAVNAGLWLTVLAHLPLDRLVATGLTWWLGDAAGVLVVTPLCLAFAQPRRERPARATEGVLLAVLAPAIASLSFGLLLPAEPGVSLALLPFPLLMWAALRFGLRGATAVTATVTLAAVIGTMAGTGPFRSGSAHADVASLWSLLAALSITSLLLAVALEEREREATMRRDRERWLSVAVDASRATPIERDLAGARVRLRRNDDADDWVDASTFRERIVEEDRARVDATIAEGADDWECEYRLGSRHMLERSRVVERDEARRAVRTVGLCRDITDRHNAEEHRRSLQRELEGSKRLSELGLLAGGIAHDFNNLLVVVRANADLLRLGGERYMNEAVEAIDTAAVRAAELTDQLLAYAGRRPMRRRDVDLAALAIETVRMLRPSVPSRIALDVDVAQGIRLVEGDPAQLRQLLMNLALNSVQAIDGEGRVVVRVADVESSIVLEVRDNGRGMDEETRARVFQPFFTTKEHGRGLGMAAVFGIVRTHEGRVQIESTPGSGTLVSVALPATERAPRTVQLVPQPAPSLRPRRRVLVIEGEQETRANVRRQLAEAGWDVTVAGDYTEAHARLADSGPFEAALLDASIRDARGRSFHEELRASSPELPLVLVSERGVELGAVAVLHRPFRDVELLARLHDAIAVATPFASTAQTSTAAE